jgi:hypothetical protein
MSTIFYCTELNLSNYDGSEIVSIKQNLNADFDLPSTFILLLYTRSFLLQFVHHLKLYTTFYGYTLTGTCSA